MAAKKKLFLIAGHGEGDPGACSIWGQEANYTRELAKLVKTAIGSRMSVTLYDTNKNCYAQSKRGNVPTYSDYDMTVEIHFNAKAKADPNGDGKFTGVGGYIHPNNAGRSIARAIIDRMVALGFREWLLDTSTGLLNLNRAQGQGAKYFLLETAFIDDGDDMKFYTARKEAFAQAIAQGILDGLGVKSTATQPKAEQYYRVRLTKDDEKSQLFAGTKAGALAVCKTKPGYSVFDPDMKCIYTNNAKGLQASALKGLSEKEWIEKVGPLYTADEKNSGILACVSLAQGILESGYGQTDLAQAGNNLHGMKTSLSGNTWPGTTWDGSSKYTKESPEQDANGNQYNFGADANVPFIRFNSDEEEDQKEAVDMYRTLVCDMGLKVPASHVYKRFSIPEPEEGEETLQPNMVARTHLLDGSQDDDMDPEQLKDDSEALTPEQIQLDDMADLSNQLAARLMEQMVKPLKTLVEHFDGDLGDLQEFLKDEEKLKALYEDMESPELEDLLHQTIYLSSVIGRTQE